MILRRVASRTWACEALDAQGSPLDCPEFAIVELEEARRQRKLCHRHAVERIDQLHAAALVLVAGFAANRQLAAVVAPALLFGGDREL